MNKSDYKKEYLDIRDFSSLPILAQRIRKLLDFYGASASALSKETGISQSVIKKYLNEDVDIGIKNLTKIADALNTSIDYLVGKTEFTKVNPTAVAACQYTGLTEDAVRMLHLYKERQQEDPDFSANETAILSEFISSGTLFQFANMLQGSIDAIKSLIKTHESFINNSDDVLQNDDDYYIEETSEDRNQYRLGRFEAIDEVTNFVKAELEDYDKQYQELFDKCMRILHPEEYENDGEHNETQK